MKIKITLLSIEIQSDPKKKSPAPKKPQAQSISQKTDIIINHK